MRRGARWPFLLILTTSSLAVQARLARWIRAGAEICCILVTSGDGGIAKPELTRDQVTAIREEEQRAASAVLGVQELVFLREPDGMVENNLALRKRLVREIRRFRPEVVVCGDPTAWFVDATYVNHPDHRAVAAAAIEAVFPAAGQPHVYEELAVKVCKLTKCAKST